MPDVAGQRFFRTMRIAAMRPRTRIAVAPHVVHELSLQVVGALSNSSW